MTNRFFSVIIQSVENIGASPSGKATDSDSVITGVRIPVPQPNKSHPIGWLFCLAGAQGAIETRLQPLAVGIRFESDSLSSPTRSAHSKRFSTIAQRFGMWFESDRLSSPPRSAHSKRFSNRLRLECGSNPICDTAI